jgi:WD40 repeat protein
MLTAGDRGGIVKVWDWQSRKLLATLDPEHGREFRVPSALRFSEDGRQLAAGITRYTSNKLFELWNTVTWQPMAVPALVHTNNWFVVASTLSPDATKLATATRGSLILWDVRDGRSLLKQPINFSEAFYACSTFSPDGRFLAYHSSGIIHVWDLVTQKCLASIAGKSDRCLYMAFSPDGRLLVASYLYEDIIQVWALPEARLVTTLDSAQRWICGLSFSPDGLNLASAGADRTIIVWDCRTWKPIRTLRGHSDEVWRVLYSPDGNWLASASKDKTVKMWKAGPSAPKVPFVPYPPDLYSHNWRTAYLCRQGDCFIMARTNGTFTVYSKSSLRALGEYRLPVTDLVIGDIAPDGRHLACWCADGNIHVFEVKSLKQIALFKLNTKGQRVLAFSPDGKVLAGCAYNFMWAWNLESQTEIMRSEKNPGGGVLTMAFSPDSRWLACSQYGTSTAVVWDLATKQTVAMLNSGELAVRDTAIDPLRRYVVTVGDEDDAKLWDPLTQTLIASLRGLSTFHLSVAFSPDGRRFATGGGIYVTLWDMTTQREVAVLKSPHGYIVWLEFLADGNALLVATERGVFSWRAPSFEEIARAEQGH